MDWADETARTVVAGWDFGSHPLGTRIAYEHTIAAALRAERAAGRAEGIEAAAHEAEARTRIPLTVIGSPEDVLQAELMADLSELVVRDIAAAIRKLGAHAP